MLPSYATDPDAVLKDVPEDIKWRQQRIPNYSKVHTFFEKHKSTNHAPNSLEFIVQNIVKNWEKEASHKLDPRQWQTIDVDNYRFSCNGLQVYSSQEMIKIGTYTALIGETNYYNPSLLSFDETHAIFKTAFGQGFAWELIEVYSGPPNISFKWRHFGTMTDAFTCRGISGHAYTATATHKMINLFGMCKATVTEDLKIQDLQIFFDPNQLFNQLVEICPYAPFAKLPKAVDEQKETTEIQEENKTTSEPTTVIPEKVPIKSRSKTCSIV